MSDNQQSIGDLIREFYKLHHRENSIEETKILESWNSVVGEYIGYHTLDLKIRNEMLYVKVDADSLRTELMYSRSLLVKKLNEVAGKELLKDIVII